MVCYGIFCSGHLPSFFTLIMTICPKIANCFRKGQKEKKTTSVYRLMFLILYGCSLAGPLTEIISKLKSSFY